MFRHSSSSRYGRGNRQIYGRHGETRTHWLLVWRRGQCWSHISNWTIEVHTCLVSVHTSTYWDVLCCTCLYWLGCIYFSGLGRGLFHWLLLYILTVVSLSTRYLLSPFMCPFAISAPLCLAKLVHGGCWAWCQAWKRAQHLIRPIRGAKKEGSGFIMHALHMLWRWWTISVRTRRISTFSARMVRYIPVHTSTYQYIPVHTSLYLYIPTCTDF